ncbi:hypothetical protein C1I95_12490 [Micromonospora craterilacus]|uniref:Uncharacterized protein n=1 Tax=Micromonospora craterilacus TaxID=1655439 RepID=A0A2W2EQE9_9ACTN|nr:hypothetical protein [Micromonospora craterilacus]PZG18989.1 hypothetical protein C1I95_12490 [Micromonospora craterilacus]
MEPTVLVALIGAGGALAGGAIVGPVVGHLLSRRARAGQAAIATAQAEQLRAEADKLRQDIYQELTQDLRGELQRVRTALETAQQSLAQTSGEAERLRQRVTALESRIAQLERTEQHLSAELRATQAERDQLRIALAKSEATCAALTAQVGDLKAQLTLHADRH